MGTTAKFKWVGTPIHGKTKNRQMNGRARREIRILEILMNIKSIAKFAIESKSTAKFAIE